MSHQHLHIIKIGGQIIDNQEALDHFLKKLASVQEPWILIHGGGKIATQVGNQMSITPHYHEGRRITDSNTRDLVTMVYGGLVNKKIVAKLQHFLCPAIGLTGADLNLLLATRRPVADIDFGFVGDLVPSGVNTQNLQSLLQLGSRPVIAPLTHDGNGEILNTNADTIASAIAISLSTFFHVRLVYCFEKKGVLKNVNDNSTVIRKIAVSEIAQLINECIISEGMIPKIQNAALAISQGVSEVVIGEAADVLQNLSSNTEGTLIVS
jgi:acetylglutamate kinase